MRPNPKDKRSKRVWITAEGRAFREEAIAALLPDLGTIAEAFPPEELALLLPRLSALRAHLDRARDSEG
jgi:DNA-binding MarR family transcriptional regulator